MLATGLPPPPSARPASTGTMINGTLRVQSNAQMAEVSRLAEARRIAAEQANAPVVIGLVDLLKKHWTLAKEAKQPIELKMLSAVRSRRGEYDPEVLADIRNNGGSEIYMMIFATKARQLKALLADIIVGTGTEKPWTLSPTPIPTLPPAKVNEITQAVFELALQAENSGMPMSVEQLRQKAIDLKNMVEARVMEEAEEEARIAENEIEDIMVEGNFLEVLDQFIDDLCVFKSAIMKGPVVQMVNELQWTTDEQGAPKAEVKRVPKRIYKRVDPFRAYPSPWSTNVHDGYFIEHHRLARAEIESFIGVESYSEDAIRAVLDQYDKGGLHEWLQIDAQRAQAEGRETLASDINRSDLIDALQYWGAVSGKMLREWGMSETEVPDEARQYEVELWLIGDFVIKAVINPDPLQRRPYYMDGFSRIPGAFWHNSLFDVIRDCQDMCNAAARALANNMGIGSGPQVAVNVQRLPAGEQITQMHPWKIWQFTSDPMGSTAKAIDFFQPDSNASALMAVFERFSLMADEYSGIPKYMAGMAGGEGGAGRTASGMSMMISNASKQIKATISSIDLHVIGPVVERTYQHLLMFDPERGLTGDLQVRARGATSLIAKESAQVRLNEFLVATGNPIDMQIIGMDGRAELLRSAVKRLDLPSPDKVVPNATTALVRAWQMQMAQMQAQAAQGGQPALPGAPGNQRSAQPSGQELMDGGPVTDNFAPQGA